MVIKDLYHPPTVLGAGCWREWGTFLPEPQREGTIREWSRDMGLTGPERTAVVPHSEGND